MFEPKKRFKWPHVPATKALKIHGNLRKSKYQFVCFYSWLGNLFSQFGNPFSWISNSFPSIIKSVLPDCSSLPRSKKIVTIYLNQKKFKFDRNQLFNWKHSINLYSSWGEERVSISVIFLEFLTTTPSFEIGKISNVLSQIGKMNCNKFFHLNLIKHK